MRFATRQPRITVVTTMERLALLLLEHPNLTSEVFVPCALWGLLEREDDAAVTARFPVHAQPPQLSIQPPPR